MWVSEINTKMIGVKFRLIRLRIFKRTKNFTNLNELRFFMRAILKLIHTANQRDVWVGRRRFCDVALLSAFIVFHYLFIIYSYTIKTKQQIELGNGFRKQWFVNLCYMSKLQTIRSIALSKFSLQIIPFPLQVVEIVDSSSGEESSSSSSDSDDCIMLSDSEVPPSPEAEDDPNNSGME